MAHPKTTGKRIEVRGRKTEDGPGMNRMPGWKETGFRDPGNLFIMLIVVHAGSFLLTTILVRLRQFMNRKSGTSINK